MTTYAIGDLQGAYDAISRLLDRLQPDPADRLWFCGDLINRGGQSLATLRLVRSLDAQSIVVLGNHDLHFLAEAERSPTQRQHNPELDEILAAPDADELVDWLRQRPLLHVDSELGYALVHAGIAPQWDRDRALALADELQRAVRGEERADFFAHMYGKKPDCWDDGLAGYDRLRVITNVLTRMRFCEAGGRLCLGAKGPPGTQPAGCYPWFAVPGRRPWEETIVFGHWSALGLYRGYGVLGLDTGYVWGGALTAVALEDPQQTIQVPFL